MPLGVDKALHRAARLMENAELAAAGRWSPQPEPGPVGLRQQRQVLQT